VTRVFEVIGIVLVLLIVGALIVRYVLRVLTGAETGCGGCPGCAEAREENSSQGAARCACLPMATSKDACHEWRRAAALCIAERFQGDGDCPARWRRISV